MNTKSVKTSVLISYLSSWRLPWVIFTLLVFSGLIKLSLWQFERSDEKQQRLTNIEILNKQQALDLNFVLADVNSKVETLNDIPVALEGEFNNQYKFLVDNQTHQGRLGYRVLQVFIDDSSGKSVLVNLGWIEGSIDRSFIPNLNDIKNRQNIKGNIRIIEQGIVLTEEQLTNDSWPQRIQQIDIEKISQLINIKLLPFVVFLDKKEHIGYTKNWQPVVMPPEKHTGYAVQWFTLAIAWLSLMIWASYKTYRTED
ncbi:SURF1 family protein [Thalassotalea psychrophila]|uniref:SURF1-like protein n=1 Tax=Thalassotalea psychrophila TaxID=3065647 RepID=A0ABY9TTN7_9GAMM|nr:SURF1 family protein [Colwelliaceae bacterium SQ149]